MVDEKKNCIVVCGPTASGKTRLAVEISVALNGEILSADSRQVYRGMDIGTGKDLSEYTGENFSIRHHLIDICEPSAVYSLYDYKNDFEKSWNDVISRGKMPVIAGGTGLYIESVLRNYDIPAIPEDAQMRTELMKKDKGDLIRKLADAAPDLLKKTDVNSKKRIVRAIEVAAYHKSVPQCNKTAFPVLDPVILCTEWDRSELLQRIDRRLEERLEHGLIDEVRTLFNNGISVERMSMFGMEYKHVAQYLGNEVTYGEMVDKLKTAIHQLSKRQVSWFRGMQRRGFTVHMVRNASFDAAMKILKENYQY